MSTMLAFTINASAYDDEEFEEVERLQENGIFYEIKNEKAIVTGSTITTGKVEIPSTLGGYEVDRIASSAFYRKNITEVIIPNTVTKIGSYAFERANNLRELSFSTNLTRLNSYSISNCKNLKILILNSKKIKIFMEQCIKM